MKILFQTKKVIFILLIIVCAISCGVGGNNAISTDQENIQGTWLAQTESQNGNRRAVSYQYVFSGDQLSFTDETGKELKYSFKLDTSSKPRLITILPIDTLAGTTPVSVAYELNADSLTIVVAPAGLRPSEISDRNNQELITCRRKGE